MIDLTTQIIPYEGTGIFKFSESYETIKSKLNELKIPYSEEIWDGTGYEIQWTVITVEESVRLFFAKNKLFKIILQNNFKGSLPNSINLDTDIEEAQEIDETLMFNDWDEIFESDNGYWVEDNLDTKKLLSISIFIPAVERDDFYEYNW